MDCFANKYSGGEMQNHSDAGLKPDKISRSDQAEPRDPINAYLVFINLPETLTLDGLVNLCSSRGKVLRANKHGDGNKHFVNFASVADMERAFTGLKNNPYGFKVSIGRTVKTNLQSHINMGYESWEGSPKVVNAERFAQVPQNSMKDKADTPDAKRYFAQERYFTNGRQSKEDELEKDSGINGSSNASEKVADEEQYTEIDEPQKLNFCRTVDLISAKKKMYLQGKETSSPRDQEVRYVSRLYKKGSSGFCENCQKECETMCERCSSWYCSEHCQKSSWEKHRRICGKPLSVILSLFQKLSETQSKEFNPDWEYLSEKRNASSESTVEAPLPPSGSKVVLVSVSSVNVMFIRSLVHDDILNYFNTTWRVQHEGKFQQPIQNTPKIGDIVLVKAANGQYNRAIVLTNEDVNNIKVLFIEFGYVDYLPQSKLLTAPDLLWLLPRTALLIELKDIPKTSTTPEVKTLIDTYINKELRLVYDTDPTTKKVTNVELFEIKTGKSFNKAILARLPCGIPQNSGNIVTAERLQHLPLPVGKNIKLIVMDNSVLHTKFISCTVASYERVIESFTQDIQTYMKSYNSDETYKPRINEICLVKYEKNEEWYRGQCLEYVGESHSTIFFIDYGNISTIPVRCMKKCPEDFNFPVMTFDCEIHGLPDHMPHYMKQKLEAELTPRKEIMCDEVVKTKDDDKYKINIESILNKIL